jgi:hypothetical protein
MTGDRYPNPGKIWIAGLVLDAGRMCPRTVVETKLSGESTDTDDIEDRADNPADNGAARGGAISP